MTLIRVKNLKKQFQIGSEIVNAIKDISFEVNAGEFISIMGPSGSGKTTLMNIIGCLDTPTSGEYHLDDSEVSLLDDDELAAIRNRKIGFVFQDFKLLSDRSIYKNLEFVLKATDWKDKQKINERIDEVLNEVGMINLKDRMPYQLSGGEQQRISIARAILNKPNLILADEPTGNLDPGTSKEIMNLLIKINNQGSTILMATHDYDMISNFPKRTLRLEDGKLYELTKKT